MKKFAFLLIPVFAYCTSAFAQSNTYARLSPRTQQYLLTLKRAGGKLNPLPTYVYKKTPSGITVSAMVKVNPGLAESDLTALGVHVGTRAGKVWTVQIPLASVEAFTKIKGIDYIELDEPVCKTLDSVRIVTHVDSVQAGTGLPMAYTGKGVVVGVVDFGFDFTHPTLYDTLGTSYRVKRVWEEKTAGTPPAGFSYGNEITDTLAMRAAGTDNAAETHGMHVTGIATGSGNHSLGPENGRYRGMAFDADVVLVGILPDSDEWQNTGMSDFVDGINYVFTYAASVGEPAVVNLSWGTTAGPHDGTSLFSQACDALTGPGKIFVCAGGNNGQDDIHLQKSFNTTDTVVSTFVGFDPNESSNNTWLDIWGDSGKPFCVNVGLYNDSIIANTGYVCLDDTVHQFYLLGSNGDTCFLTLTTYSSEFNGRTRAYFSFDSRVTDTICLSIKSTSGTINLWNGYVSAGEGYFGQLTTGGRSWATAGDSMYTVDDIVSTNSAISAAAFVAKWEFPSILGGEYFIQGYDDSDGIITAFSSLGPTVDGRIKPDIAAPGLCVVSSLNSFDKDYIRGGSGFSSVVSGWFDADSNKYYYYGQFSGTSMASPCTAGIVALMLQANPLLNPSDVRAILAQTAIQDSFTGVLPAEGNNQWGHGKINAYNAVTVATTYPVSGIKPLTTSQLRCQLFPNPNNGNFTIQYTADKNEPVRIETYDQNGRLVMQNNWYAAAGVNTKVYNLSQLAKGIYLIKIISPEGSAVIKNTIVR